MTRTIIVLVALLIASIAAFALGWCRARFWKRIARESQASATFWHRRYEAQIGYRPLLSVKREGASWWLDVEELTRGGR